MISGILHKTQVAVCGVYEDIQERAWGSSICSFQGYQTVTVTYKIYKETNDETLESIKSNSVLIFLLLTVTHTGHEMSSENL